MRNNKRVCRILASILLGVACGAAEPEKAPFAVTIAPAYFFLQGIRVTGEYLPWDHLGLALTGGFTTAQDREGNGLGGQVRYYPFAASEGFHAGAEALRIRFPDEPDYVGWFVGPFIGYKYTAGSGFTLGSQVGAALTLTGLADDGFGMPKGVWIPLLNLDAGWSFREERSATLAQGLNRAGVAGLIVRGGLNAANAVAPAGGVSCCGENEYHLGANLALLADIPLFESLHVLAGLGYENKGFEDILKSEGFRFTQKIDLNYATLPLLVSYRFPAGVFLNGGLEPAFLLAGAEEEAMHGDDGEVADVTLRKSLTNQANRFDVNLLAEAGFQIPLTKTLSGMIGMGYSYGLLDWDDDSGTDRTAHNYAIHLYAGLNFGLAE